MSQYAFGSGVLFGRSLDNSPPTPVRFGVLQGCNVDIAFTSKQLYGQNQFPVALGRGTGKITGKADFAQLNAQVYNDLFFGNTNPSTGEYVTQVAESANVAANAATVTHNGAGTYVRDLGVVRSSDSAVLTRVSATPTGLQYTVNETTGVYGFNASLNGTLVGISYQWNDAANGKTIVITNNPLGNSPQFMAVFTETFRGKKFTLQLNACMSSKLTLPSKLEDFWVPSFDFEAFSDDSGEVGRMFLDE